MGAQYISVSDAVKEQGLYAPGDATTRDPESTPAGESIRRGWTTLAVEDVP